MILDLIFFRPEFFQLFGFFVQLRFGTGNLVTPVAEILTVTNQPLESSTAQKKTFVRAASNKSLRVNRNLGNTEFSMLQTRGPNHAVSAQTLWAVIWCFLSFQLAITCPMHLVFLGGSFQKDAYSLSQCRLLFLTGCIVLRVSYGWQKVARISHTEYIYLAMQALIGQYQQIMATDQMSLYLCMEQQSFSLVVLCGQNTKSAYSLEAAMKYFLLSAFRSCQLLLGVGFIYWQTGETSLPHIEKIVQRTTNNPSLLTALGVWLISTGLLWKLAAAPQHFWVPDVYMGAWSSVSLWITVLPKIAVLGFWTHHWHVIWSLSFGSAQTLFRAFSMIVGRIAPQAQTNIKRLLAYSSIGHNGQLLVPQCSVGAVSYGISNENFSPFMNTPADSIGVLWAYMIIYVIINAGVWGMLFWPIYRPLSLFASAVPTGAQAEGQKNRGRYEGHQSASGLSFRGASRAAPQFLWDQKGLNRSSARAAFRWAVFMTSLAGLPPVYSFQGKAAIIWHRVNNELFILVAVALRYTMIGSVYYLKVMKIAYVDNSNSWASYGKVSPLTAYIIAISVFIMLIGLWHGNTLFQYSHLQALTVSFSASASTSLLRVADGCGAGPIYIFSFKCFLVCICVHVQYCSEWGRQVPSRTAVIFRLCSSVLK